MRLGVAALVDGTLVPDDVELVDGAVSAVGLGASGGRGLAARAFVDLHVHGFDGGRLQRARHGGVPPPGRALLASGVTAFRPSFVTAPEDELDASIRKVQPGDVGCSPGACRRWRRRCGSSSRWARLPSRRSTRRRASRRAAGRPGLGTLAPGTPADAVVLDGAFEGRRPLVGGRDAL
jgi:cytosine/adenosine deaminase-related metal-dependent hydrolase